MSKNSDYRVCPKTGKIYKIRQHHTWYKWFLPLTGLLATLWFLIRVIPKPSRAEYPCQRVAFPIASSFVAYLIGIFTTAVLVRRVSMHIKRAKYIIAAVCLCAAITTAWFTIGIDAFQASATMFVPTDGNNHPMGVARGIYPGRVVWVHDSNATTWDHSLDTSTIVFYWDDNHTNQAVVDQMYSKGIRWLTDSTTDEEAWGKLFRYFNQRHGKGNVGYVSGEKIAIKPNHVEQRRLFWENNYADLSPQMMVSLLKQLVNTVGVPQNCITICDSSRYIANKEYDRCHALFPNVHYLVTNFYADKGDDRYVDPNRPPVTPSDPCVTATHYSHLGATGHTIPPTAQPMPFVEANYVVNLAIMKGHTQVGATFCGKNWYGCFCAKPGSATATYPMPWNDPADTAHAFGYIDSSGVWTMGHYRPVVDLMGNRNFGEKTVLFILDGLWGFAKHSNGSYPQKYTFPPFTNTDPNGDYPSSLFMSQDMVAIDSVGLDFVRAQYGNNLGTTNLYRGVDDYMHEAAEANNPPSGTVYGYEPNGVQRRFPSLGVHEHWNNSTDKKYTRNLGTGNGIELTSSDPLCIASLDADLTDDCKVNFYDFVKVAHEWHLTPVNADINKDGYVNMRDIRVLASEWLTCGFGDPNMCWQ
ncbi:MAG: DUF362 domain-containing protein [Sedimentisphaerales bacterium]